MPDNFYRIHIVNTIEKAQIHKQCFARVFERSLIKICYCLVLTRTALIKELFALMLPFSPLFYSLFIAMSYNRSDRTVRRFSAMNVTNI